jgi:hypothetical protein
MSKTKQIENKIDEVVYNFTGFDHEGEGDFGGD